MRQKSTEKQRNLVHLCEKKLDIIFEGNINDAYECNLYLSEYLDEVHLLSQEYHEDYIECLSTYTINTL